VGEEAGKIRVLMNSTAAFDSSISLGERRATAYLELAEACVEAHSSDWDGMSAAAVEGSTYHYAKQFLDLLPGDVPIPEIYVDRDGEICFEWDCGCRQVFSVCIGRDGTLTYAGLFGHSKSHGVEHLGQALPQAISTNIRRATSALTG
jgi:hypothetical protein